MSAAVASAPVRQAALLQPAPSTGTRKPATRFGIRIIRGAPTPSSQPPEEPSPAPDGAEWVAGDWVWTWSNGAWGWRFWATQMRQTAPMDWEAIE